MKRILSALVLLLLLASCGNSSKDSNASLNDKKAELEKLRGEQKKLSDKITALEAEIAKADPAASAATAKLVAVQPLSTDHFTHFIELQGRVESSNISYAAPRNGGGLVKAVYVTQGQPVRKGQLLLKLDDAVQRTQVAAVEAQLATARDLYNRQQRLWKEEIGTEVQLVQARSAVTGLEKQLATAREGMSMSNVYAETSGIADEVTVHAGEMFAANPMGPHIKIVNNSALKVTANIPENYLPRVKQGTPVQIYLPDLKRTLNSSISVISQSINADTRGFVVEARIPADPALKPNQVVQVKIQDYNNPNVVTVPLNVVQSDEKGKYVYVLAKEGAKSVARKRAVIVGESYGERVEVKSGLASGDQLITEGYQELYEGQVVAIAK
ncbi:efflux RND transporter periplasmic adaptor subunit [Flaviaesturariibacter aridisoli]|uniref:Efflux RND transporter periplasmic adaptor subunit n=1 Tax=Flaviaesturariibacter aridisoli TaxID=2545761 RepID=A0A4R4DYA7_9BACT|nr:efflux RND transporter periplasmic adaptor subunit [Flaviaesturariibacter aridisoli]TCZ68836.1 efflux RND transporter periplasmic adaptor subunit [Flaviaesturariibacter aridisoli]